MRVWSSHLVDVWLLLQLLQRLKQVAATYFCSAEPPVPIAIHHIEDATNHSLYVPSMELWCGGEELQSRMGVHHVLHQDLQIFLHQIVSPVGG